MQMLRQIKCFSGTGGSCKAVTGIADDRDSKITDDEHSKFIGKQTDKWDIVDLGQMG